ncbi:MAG TPA: ATP-binding protein, partial [Gemmatimonadales bacterium]|nr:ATP-binding protein [Gemmatimonadales bacterium]
VGKTHLAISLAIAAAQSGRRVYYGTLADLITSLEEAQQAGRLTQRLRTLVFPSLLVVDEIGYLPISRTGATLFFQLMSRRYETGATILTSNKGFDEWGGVFGDDVMAGPQRPWAISAQHPTSSAMRPESLSTRMGQGQLPTAAAPRRARTHCRPDR